MKHFRKSMLIGTLTIGALALAGCTATDPAAERNADAPIKIVVFGGIGAEGTLAGTASTSVAAAAAGVAAVNDDGGVLGRELELVVVDDTADPTVAVTKLRELLAAGDKPAAIMNSGPSTIADAMIPIMTQNQIVSFNIGPTSTSADPSVSPFNFDLSPSVLDHVEAFVPVIEERGFERVGILHGSSAYGEQYGRTAVQIFQDAGLDVIGTEGFDNAALDMVPQLMSLRESDPEVIVLDAYGAPFGYVMQGLDKLGWDVPVLGTTSVSATALVSTEPPAGLLGTDQVANLSIQMFQSTKNDPAATAVNEMVERIAAAGDIKSSLTTAANYDAVLLLAAAMEKAGTADDAEAIAEALTQTEVQQAAETVVLGLYRFTEESHTPHARAEEFVFVTPGPMVNGQFH